MDEVREIVFDEVKLFECECEVLNIDAKHPLLELANLAVDGETVIQVEGYDGKLIGAVSFGLRMDGKVIAHLQLEFSCPERLDIETGKVYLDVNWYLGDESTTVFDQHVEIGWIEPESAKLVQKKPFPDATPIKVK